MGSEDVTVEDVQDDVTEKDEKWLTYLNHELITLSALFKNRKICTSASGHFCLVPFHAKRGDATSILHGGRLPCVLPHHSGNADVTTLVESHDYRFLGGCFVAGIMHGEAFGACLNQDKEPVKFKLV